MKHYLFDVDGTLTPSRTQMDDVNCWQDTWSLLKSEKKGYKTPLKGYKTPFFLF